MNGVVIYQKDFANMTKLKEILKDKIASGASKISVVFDDCDEDENSDENSDGPTGPTGSTGSTGEQGPTGPGGTGGIEQTEANPRGGAEENNKGKGQAPPSIEFLSHNVQGNYNVFSWSNAEDCDDCTYTISIKCVDGCEGGNLDYEYTGTTHQLSIRLNLGDEERGVSYKKHNVTVKSKRNNKTKTITRKFELVCKQ